MDKRYQVFVSSTYTDLIEERAEVIQMLLSLDALPSGMELFPATNDDAWTLIQRMIDESDYYLLVIGGRYGSLDAETNLSYTEKEFDYAISQSKPVMAFVHAAPAEIVAGKTELSDGGREKLDAFREKVKGAVHVRHWTGASELAGLVAAGFTKIQKSHPAVGWVRGDMQTSTESLKEINELRKRLEAADSKIEASRRGPPPGTEEYSQGQDQIAFNVGLSGPLRSDGQYFQAKPYMQKVSVTWDALFAAIAPAMFNEASQAQIRTKLVAWLSRPAKADLLARLGAEHDETFRFASNPTPTMSDAGFDTVLVQLSTLGLITQSERKQRSLKDRATYWSLTPYGREKMQALRAVRRNPNPQTS